MIKSFADKETESLWQGKFSKKLPPELQRKAQGKLGMLNNIKDIKELRIPPSNKLHSLEGDRKGQFAISINDQWRICFSFKNGDVFDVEIVDYH
ncbi:type II toxin-antitoxin system RelE/ParE family toxin [Leptospira biflexa]|uniref:type II toxin-antitoxin system RelE/ParE family toxin n=1 Tax=Leptospira biflexa TaxID=172 RepID=UPI0010848C25|nr:type II toxin-antitoxin system RelE/ParE family toxin [Leptospira biflexa]TGM31743.1 plasmid maintenance system killer protein [Leptospira biflexa]TGM39263.1 plasmid maintenance system killer protein [Leptospira biflexa]